MITLKMTVEYGLYERMGTEKWRVPTSVKAANKENEGQTDVEYTVIFSNADMTDR